MARTAVLSVRIVGDSRGARRAVHETERAIGGLQRAASAAGPKIASGLRFGAVAAAAAGAGSGILGAVPAVAAFATAAAQAGGAALLLPGAMGAAKVASSALKLGLSGVSDALKNVGDSAKFAESIKDMAPAAQDTMRAVQGVSGAWGELRGKVQGRLFEGVASQIKPVSSAILPDLTRGLTAAAGGWNVIARNALGAVGTLGKMGVITSLGEAAGTILGRMGGAVRQIIVGFGALAQAGAEWLPPLTFGLEQVGMRFGRFLQTFAQSTTFEVWVNNSVRAIQYMASAAGSLWTIVSTVFRSISGASAGMGNPFQLVATGLAQVAAIVQQPAIQTGIANAFTIAGTASRGLLGALVPIGGVFLQLLAVVAPVAAQLSGTLTTTLTALTPGLQSLVPAVGALATALGTVLGAVLPVVAQLLSALAPVVAAVVVQVANLVTAIASSAPFQTMLSGLVTGVTIAVQAAIPLLGRLSSWITGTLLPALAGTRPQFAGITGWLMGSLVPAVMAVLSSVRGAAVVVFGIVVSVVRQVLGALRPMLPQIRGIFATIGQVISAALQLVAAIVSRVTSVVSVLWRMFGSNLVRFATTAFGAILSVIRNALNLVLAVVRTVTALLRGDWRGFFSGLRSIASSGMALVRSVFSAAFTLIKAAFTLAWSNLKVLAHNGMVWVYNAVVLMASKVKDAIVKPFKDAKALIEPILSGLRSAASGLGNLVPDFAAGGPLELLANVTPGVPFTLEAGAYTGGYTPLRPPAGSSPMVVRITINGALDPIAVGRQVEASLSRLDAVRGGVTTWHA